MYADKAVALVHSVREVCQLLKCGFYLIHLPGVLLNNTVARMKLPCFSQQLFTDFKGDNRLRYFCTLIYKALLYMVCKM